jgi:hypothetical protein
MRKALEFLQKKNDLLHARWPLFRLLDYLRHDAAREVLEKQKGNRLRSLPQARSKSIKEGHFRRSSERKNRGAQTWSRCPPKQDDWRTSSVGVRAAHRIGRKKRGVSGTLCANAGYGGGGTLFVHLQGTPQRRRRGTAQNKRRCFFSVILALKEDWVKSHPRL